MKIFTENIYRTKVGQISIQFSKKVYQSDVELCVESSTYAKYHNWILDIMFSTKILGQGQRNYQQKVFFFFRYPEQRINMFVILTHIKVSGSCNCFKEYLQVTQDALTPGSTNNILPGS